MSQMPDSVYMHKDAKYNTCGIDTVYSENYLLAENDFNEECLQDYVEYTPMYRLEEDVRDIKEQMIERACEWLRTCNYTFPYKLIEDFKQAMGE